MPDRAVRPRDGILGAKAQPTAATRQKDFPMEGTQTLDVSPICSQNAAHHAQHAQHAELSRCPWANEFSVTYGFSAASKHWPDLAHDPEASGDPVVGTPTEDGLGGILGGAIEMANVDPVRELIDLIFTQRAFEMNARTIEAADEALRTINNMRR